MGSADGLRSSYLINGNIGSIYTRSGQVGLGCQIGRKDAVHDVERPTFDLVEHATQIFAYDADEDQLHPTQEQDRDHA